MIRGCKAQGQRGILLPCVVAGKSAALAARGKKNELSF